MAGDIEVRVEWHDETEKRLLALVRRKFFAVHAVYERTWQILLRTAKTGRFYKVSKTGKLHQASAAGEPPAARSGAAGLAGSIAHEVIADSPEEIVMIEGTTLSARYPRFLEDGTPGGQMAPRPSWLPAIDATRAKLGEVFTEEND